MSKEFVDIHSLYENLYEDLEQLDEIGPVSKTQKLKARQARLSQVKSDWQARRSANNTPAPTPTPTPTPVAKPAPQAQAAPAPQQQRVVSGQGNRQMPVKTGGIQLGKAIKGGLSRLGSLAGKAVNALQNKGPIQGRQTGTQRRAQQSQVRAARPAVGGAQAQAAPAQQAQAQTRPALSNNSPAAKAGIPLSIRQRAADNHAKFQANRRPGRTVGAPQGSGRPGSMVRAQGNQAAPQAQAQAKPVGNPIGGNQAQAKPVGNSLNQAAANIDAMRSPASGSRQVKPGLIGRLLPNHPGNKGQQQSGGQQVGGTQQTTSTTKKPVAQGGENTTTSTSNAMGGKTTTTQSGNKKTVTTTGGTNLAKDGAAETIKKYQAIQDYKKRKGLPYQKVTIGKEGDPDPFNFHYEPEGDLIADSFDITVDFLINEGHAIDASEAISIMSDPEFIAGFNAELNESFENNK